MANFSEPTVLSDRASLPSTIRDLIHACGKHLQDTTSHTNIPNNFKRYNGSTNRYENYHSDIGSWVKLGFHTEYDDHIANADLHAGFPIGGVLIWASPSALPANGEWAYCTGQAISRTNYATLFGLLSTHYGVGDGSTTFNLPEYRLRLPIMSDSGSPPYNVLGYTFGSLDHTHSTSDHTHFMTAHAHPMNHNHSMPTHNHSMPDHQHTVPGHFHDSRASGATINIQSSGEHNHTIPAHRDAGAFGANAELTRANTGSGGSREDSVTGFGVPAEGNHIHPNSSFSGTVGNVASGNNGDAGFVTSTAGAGVTGTGGGGTTGSSSELQTGTQADVYTGASGAGTTGGNNPPCIIVNFIMRIK